MGIDSEDLRTPIVRFRQAVHKLARRLKSICNQHLIRCRGSDDAAGLEAREMIPQLAQDPQNLGGGRRRVRSELGSLTIFDIGYLGNHAMCPHASGVKDLGKLSSRKVASFGEACLSVFERSAEVPLQSLQTSFIRASHILLS